ncbi:protein smoothened [Scaptodrosophila lebanonensis]|uniref:Protein smoothened n=1 Tax=Drosophila lebanonensis TaxID=7225 RepID=A0A6J2UAZ6_DROLE|nr:protein smoothened [Scaptodrosophila lebanonensis]
MFAYLVSTCLLLVCGLTVVHGSSKFSSTTQSSVSQIDLDPITETLNYRIFGKKANENKMRFDGLDVQCVRHGRCIPVDPEYSTCFGIKLPYNYTSLDLTDFYKKEKLNEVLSGYHASLRHVPKCWAVIQPFLCAVFKPKCEEINGKEMVYLPSLEMCRITLEPCRVLYNTTFFPKFLRCNETLFPSKCSNDVREMKFNVTGSCLKPLVSTDSSASYYPGFDGCGVQCKDPLYTDDEHRQIQKLIGWGGTLCLLSNLFVVATFLIDWKNANKYPALNVFYINLCFLIACIGWLLQFTSGSREDIVCRKDGTLRQSEPSARENLSCVVIFVMVYYFLTAGMVWFVFLTYSWHWRAIGRVQACVDKNGSYFHLVAWSLPLVLTITTMALSEVDGNGIVGICFVGYINHPMRAGFLLGPLAGVILIGGYCIIRGMVTLFNLKKYTNEIKSTSASNRLHFMIMRMGICGLLVLTFILVVIACHVTEFRHSHEWALSFRRYIICRITSVFDEHRVCKLENRPSVAILQLHLLCLFGSGILMSTWCWTPSSIETWKRYLRKKCGNEIVEDVKMPKHKVIAQTWAKRKDFEDKGRVSITLHNTHPDPTRLNDGANDVSSVETNEISTTWVNNLMQFMKRRNALPGAAATNSSSQGPTTRKNSLDSEISFSVRHVSVESRRNSVDSQVSVKIAEMKTKVASRARNHHGKHGGGSTSSRNKRAGRRSDFMASATAAYGRKSSGRRESSTSIESQVIAMQKLTYPNASQKVGIFARSTKSKHQSMKRRSANAGLDPAVIGNLLQQNGDIYSFWQNQGMSTSSEEETSCKIQDPNVADADDDYDRGIVELVPAIQEPYESSSNNNNKKQAAALEHLLKNMHKSNDSNGNRQSRNSTRSRKSQNTKSTAAMNSGAASSKRSRSTRTNKERTNPKTLGCEDLMDFNAFYTRGLMAANGETLSCSSAELELDLPMGTTHSSYSGMSLGKPNSRNSKTSCDVGIQANAYEIAASYGDDELQNAMRLLNAASRQRMESAPEEATELQTLLGHNQRHREPHFMSESEKLKMLLLPSK